MQGHLGVKSAVTLPARRLAVANEPSSRSRRKFGNQVAFNFNCPCSGPMKREEAPEQVCGGFKNAVECMECGFLVRRRTAVSYP